jgi:hypothetical protein
MATPVTNSSSIMDYQGLALKVSEVATDRITQSVRRVIPVCGNAKAGATAGWVITAGTNICHATLPASQTSSTLVVPIPCNIGDTITAVSATGQVESAGGNVTLVMSSSNLVVTGLSEVVAEGETIYALFTGTTAASTDIDLTGLVVTVTTA